MHELALTESVVTTVSEHVGDAALRELTLEVGTLSGVVADSMRFCFDICTAGTRLEGAALEIIETPGVARCRDCGDEVTLPDALALCPCGSANLEILDGSQLKIKHVEVED